MAESMDSELELLEAWVTIRSLAMRDSDRVGPRRAGPGPKPLTVWDRKGPSHPGMFGRSTGSHSDPRGRGGIVGKVTGTVVSLSQCIYYMMIQLAAVPEEQY